MEPRELGPLVRRALSRRAHVAGGTAPARSALMLVSCRGSALVRLPAPLAANDNVPGAITPDDRLVFLALALICAGVVALLAYVVLNAPDDLTVAALRR